MLGGAWRGTRWNGDGRESMRGSAGARTSCCSGPATWVGMCSGPRRPAVSRARLRRQQRSALRYEVDGLRVISPEDAAARFGPDALWLITISKKSAGHRAMPLHGRSVDHLRRAVVGSARAASTELRLRGLSASPTPRRRSRRQHPSGPMQIPRSSIGLRFAGGSSSTTRPSGPPAPLRDVLPRRPHPTQTDEVFVDCGAFTGDTIDAFVAARGGNRSR